MEDKDKTKVELIKELKTMRKKREKSAVNNITERKQAEDKLKDSEEYLKILFDYAPDAYYISDLGGNFVDCNKEAERLTGYKKEELIGKNFLKLKMLSPVDIPKEAKLFTKELSELPTGTGELVLNRKDNTKVTVEISAYPVKIKGKTFILGIARDITERKKAEKALVESEERYRAVFENTGTATVVLEEDTTGSMVNTQFEKLSGYSKEEIENKMKWTDFIVPEDLERMKQYHIERRKTGGKAPTAYEFRIKDKKGNIKDIFLKIGMIPSTKKNIASLMDITEHKKVIEQLKKTMNATIETISKMVEAKDPYTAGHQQRVSQLATAVAKELNLPQDRIEGIRIASLIHDIGKIGLPTEILSKPTKLNDIEFSLIKSHPQIGYDILKTIEFSCPVASVVLQHHERINGSGYPQGLKGGKILLGAKIIGVADVVEAISSHRPYRPALGIDKALEEISQNKGILYDPKVVDICLNLFKEKEFKFE